MRRSSCTARWAPQLGHVTTGVEGASLPARRLCAHRPSAVLICPQSALHFSPSLPTTLVLSPWQLESMRAVLESLQSHTALEHREALVALEAARRRAGELQAEKAALEERAAAAEAAADAVRSSASREWSNVKEDLSSLVAQAEAAQLSADAAVQRQREEYEAKLAAAQAGAAEAGEGRRAAEADAQAALRELAAARQEVASAEERLAAQEAALRGRLEASQAGVAALEAQVAHLQRQLAAHLRGKGVSVEPAKKVAAASGAAALLKKENQRLQAQVEGLQEQVKAGARGWWCVGGVCGCVCGGGGAGGTSRIAKWPCAHVQ